MNFAPEKRSKIECMGKFYENLKELFDHFQVPEMSWMCHVFFQAVTGAWIGTFFNWKCFLSSFLVQNLA